MMRKLAPFIAITAIIVLAGCGAQAPQMGSGLRDDGNFGFGSSTSTAKSGPGKIASTFWSLDSLKRQVQVEEVSTASEKVGDTQVVIKEITFEGERWQGNPTKVYALLAYPSRNGGTKLPAIVHIHDLAQTSSKEIAKEWAVRGYAALSIDLPGKGPSRDASRSTGPDMTIDNIFKSSTSAKESWLYPAVCSVVRGITVMANSTSVDPVRIGVAGYGWGGVIALIANGVDNRIKGACSVYGSGYLSEKSAWADKMKKMLSKERKGWNDVYDPSVYAKSQSSPVLYITATGSTEYPITNVMKMVKETQSDKACVLTPNSGKVDDLALGDIPLWFDWTLKSGSGLPKLQMLVKGNTLTVTPKGGSPAVKAVMYHKPESGSKWESIEAKPEKGIFTFTMPETAGASSYFVSVIDDRNGVVSTDVGVYRSKNVKTAGNRR